MNHRSIIGLCLLAAFLLIVTSPAFSAESQPRKAGPRDKCPVCGMFVAKYPDFAAQIQFRDGSIAHFDGAKDMFKYYLNLSRYAPGKKPTDIGAVFVTNYYDLKMVNGLTAFYVLGGDVYGPMGRELIPFAREAEARDFLKDHKGKSIIRFGNVTPAVIRSLD